ncbi:hypothetical protein [Klebsiella huaxiensis]|uniref:Prophage protein n=1 Tax=Klebsiella huaxiensis TaxID=2153354 RepID=A0ABT6ECB1_9ENTR|nr:hypothetical protein [Klebsiella huaxiensis]MDG1642956.1 hypothetical protein [Klebsiella huaxiensis]
MKEFDCLPLNTQDALNNIKHLLFASRVLEGTDKMKDVAFQLNEYVCAYVDAVINENYGESK